MVALSAFVASFAIGVGGTGWLQQGEVFPAAVGGRAAAIVAGVDWGASAGAGRQGAASAAAMGPQRPKRRRPRHNGR